MASARPASTRALTVGLLLTMSLHAIHGLAVVTALPVVARDLEGITLYGASLAAYLLASLVGLAHAGDQSDRRGLATGFVQGLGVFALGLVASGLAPTMASFVAARAVEGLGGGMLATVLYAAVNRAYPEAVRPRMLAWLSAAWIVPGLVAPPLAGFVAESFGWRWVFLGLVPVVGIAAALALPAMARVPAVEGTAASPPRTGAAVRLALAAAGLIVLLDSGAAVPWAVRALGFALAAGVAVSALGPLFPPGCLTLRPVLPAALAAKGWLTFAFFAPDSFLPLAMTEIQETSASFAGWILTVGSLAWSAGAFAQGRFVARAIPGTWIGAGVAFLWLGLASSAAVLGPAASMPWVFGGWALAGFGMGLAYNSAVATAMAATAPGREGQTSTWLGLTDALGIGVATALGGWLVAEAARRGDATAVALGQVWGLAAGAGLLVAIAAVRVGAGSGAPAELSRDAAAGEELGLQ